MAEQYDVIVVGAGAAGLAAALSAIEADPSARVCILERASRERRGGNTRYSGAYLRLASPTAPVDGLVDYGMWASKGHADRAYYEALVERVPATFEWLVDKGVQLEQLPTIFLTQSANRYQPVGGGAHIIDVLFTAVESTSAEVRYETAAERLVTDEAGAVVGVMARTAAGLEHLSAPAVVLAAGGFQANAEMMAKYIGANAYRIPPISLGGRNNRGDGLRMAQEVGGATAGQFDLFHAEPKDPRSEVAEAVVMTYPYGILVNADGQRFFDEGAATVDLTYEQVARSIFDQRDSIGYAIFDGRISDVEGRDHAIQTDVEPYAADTLEELASLIGVDADALIRTIRTFNGACDAEESAFDWSRADGLAAHPQGQPPKSNWARRIDQGPFVAYPLICANVFTFGGVATDLDARVITSDGHPIRGLYGAGEMTGLYFEAYAGSTSVMRSLVFGRVAGQHAITIQEKGARR